MTTEYSARFDLNGHAVEVDFVWFTRSGRLTVRLDRALVAEVDWCDWSSRYATDHGLRDAAICEIRAILAAADAGDIDPPPAQMLAAMRDAAAAS
jgi:hypothetical protein